MGCGDRPPAGRNDVCSCAATAQSVHDEAYLASLQAASQQPGPTRFGASTVLPAGGWAGICLAAGAALQAVDAVLAGEADVAYCLVRPPGHHASRAAMDGYCFCNNTALAVRSRGGARCGVRLQRRRAWDEAPHNAAPSARARRHSARLRRGTAWQ